MDCVRVSTRELEGERYVGDYSEILALQGSGADACRQACVTKSDCVAWEYTTDQKCKIASKFKGPHPMVVAAGSGTRAGLIECTNDWSMLKLIWWIVILGLVIVLVWYVMTRCEPRAKARGQSFFPKFSLQYR